VIRNPHAHSICRHCSKSMNKIENCNCSTFVSEERLCRSKPWVVRFLLLRIIADVVMRDLKTYCLNKINCKLTFYYRYVDDIVLASPSDKIDLILETFNSYHERLKFTIEYEDSRSLNLDLLLTISDNKIYIDWNHKKTFSERFLSFFSSHPLCHKIGTIYSLTDRAFLLSHRNSTRRI